MNDLVAASSKPGLPAILDRDVYRAVGRLNDGLLRHPALTHANRDGTRFTVRVKPDVALLGNRYALVGIDTERLWHIDTSRLVRADVLQHLSFCVGRRVRFISVEDGLYYVIEMAPRPKTARLPGRIQLPEDHLSDERFSFGETGPQTSVRLGRRWVRGLIVAGAPRSGKSTLLRSLAYQAAAKGWQLYLVDPPDSNTFVPELWSRVRGVQRIAQDDAAFRAMVAAIDAECKRRAELFRIAQRDSVPPEDLETYNAFASDPLPAMMLIADEFNTFRFGEEFINVARRGQKFGLLIVLAAHSWRSGDIPRVLSELLQSRICYRVNSREAARALMPDNPADASAALHIDVPGRCVSNLIGRFAQMQTYYVDPKRIAELARESAVESAISRAVELTDDERAVADAATNLFSGMFSVDRLAGALAGRVSRRQISQRIAPAWMARGWLDPLTSGGRPLSATFYAECDGNVEPDRPDQGRPSPQVGRSGDQGDQGDQADQGQQKRSFARPPAPSVSTPDRLWAERLITSGRA